MVDFLLIALGVGLLYGGGEALVRSASGLARTLGLSPLVIGLTLVAFGTSAPEVAATLAAAFRGSPEIAFGNVVGSNLANLGLILGISGLVYPLTTTARFLRWEVPFMLGTSVALFAVILDGTVFRLEGLALFSALIFFLYRLLKRDKETPEVREAFEKEFSEPEVKIWRALVGVALGIALLVLGAQSLITGAVGVARAMGISERVIGLTLVSIGTSLPELAAALVAAMKREGDILLGNLVGSNIFNVLCVLGLTSMLRPISIGLGDIWIDLSVMLLVSLLVWPLLFTGLRLSRREAAFLLALYGGYLGWLFA